MLNNKPHVVDLDDILAWIDREEVVAASSSREPKRLYVRLAGGYRVELRDETIYSGTDGRTAVDRYNEAK